MHLDGVYKAGFATSQSAYETNVKLVFDSLDRVEKILSQNGGEYLVGGRLTEADVRLFTTIIRFDPVYHGHFKCNFRTIRAGYPAIHKWVSFFLFLPLSRVHLLICFLCVDSGG